MTVLHEFPVAVSMLKKKLWSNS